MAIDKETLRSIAYVVATGNHLTKIYNYEEFQGITEEELMSNIWEPLQYWDYIAVVSHITQVAESFISAIEQAQK